VAGAGPFRGAREHEAHDTDGLGADVGAKALGPAAAWPGVAMRTTSLVGASRHGSNFEWLCSNTILSNFSN
jgi:hypothetical protein